MSEWVGGFQALLQRSVLFGSTTSLWFRCRLGLCSCACPCCLCKGYIRYPLNLCSLMFALSLPMILSASRPYSGNLPGTFRHQSVILWIIRLRLHDFFQGTCHIIAPVMHHLIGMFWWHHRYNICLKKWFLQKLLVGLNLMDPIASTHVRWTFWKFSELTRLC